MYCDAGLYEAAAGCDRKILKIGIPSGVENGMFQIGKLLVSSLTATFGTAAIAANAVANSVAGFANIPGIAIGLAIVTVIGRCIGAGEKEQARYYSKRLLGLAYAGMVLADLALFALVKPIIACFALSAEAARIATQLLVSFAICAALIWPLSFTLPNVLRAAGDAKYTMEVSVFPCGSSVWQAVTFCGNDGTWRARCLDRHVCGLGVPHAAFPDPLPAREVAGKARGMMPQGN